MTQKTKLQLMQQCGSVTRLLLLGGANMKSAWPEHRSWRGIHQRILFSYAAPLLHLGTKQVLEHEDLPLVCDADSAKVMGAKIEKSWAEELKRPVGQRSFFRALRRADHWGSYFFFLAGGALEFFSFLEALLFFRHCISIDCHRAAKGIFDLSGRRHTRLDEGHLDRLGDGGIA